MSERLTIKQTKNVYASKLDVVSDKEKEKIAQQIFSKNLSYKKAVELIKEAYPEIGELSIQGLKDHLVSRGFLPNKKALEYKYRKLSKNEILKEKRTIIANILFEEVLKERKEEFFNLLLEDTVFLKLLKEKLDNL